MRTRQTGAECYGADARRAGGGGQAASPERLWLERRVTLAGGLAVPAAVTARGALDHQEGGGLLGLASRGDSGEDQQRGDQQEHNRCHCGMSFHLWGPAARGGAGI